MIDYTEAKFPLFPDIYGENNNSPSVSLISPSNYGYYSSSNMSFIFMLTSQSGIKNATLWSNFSGSWHENQTNQTQLISGQQASINLTNVPEGFFVWNIYACNNLTTPVCGFALSNYTLTIDRTNPIVNISSPLNNSFWNLSKSVTFIFNVTDNSPILNCNLIINNTIYANSTSITNNIAQNLSTNLSNGQYNYFINCTDYAYNSMNSNIFNFSFYFPLSPAISSVLDSPLDNGTIYTGNITFSCNATASDSVLKNISLYLNYSTWQLNQTIFLGGASNTSNFTIYNIPYNTSIKWNCLACNQDGNCSFAAVNRTVYSMQIQSNVHYVSSSGTANWANCTNINFPCLLDTANNNAQAGDIVYLRGGIYTGDYIEPVNSGTSRTNRIIFSNYNNEKVLFRDIWSSFDLNKKSNITINGFQFYNLTHFFYIRNNASYNIISNCIFNTTSIPSTWEGASIYFGSTYNTVNNCTFLNWGSGTDGSMLIVGSEKKGDTSYYNLIENNTFYHAGHHCLSIETNFTIIRNNYMHNEYYNDSILSYGYRSLLTEGNFTGRNLFENNIIGYSQGASGFSLRSPSNIVRFNAFFNSSNSGIQAATDELDNHSRCDNNYVYNNVIMNNGYNASQATASGGIYFADWGRGDPIGNILKNNIFFHNYGGMATYESVTTPQTFINNLNETPSPLFVNESTPGPYFTLPDFHLQTGSPAIDAGGFLSNITSATGSGTMFNVSDAGYFTDGWGVIEGDVIQLQSSTKRVIITNVNYSTNTITVNETISWTQNIGVSLAYEGSAPDIGMYEYIPSSSNQSTALLIFSSANFTSVYINQTVWFYANYTNNSAFISGATCNITFNDSANSYIMNDASNSLYNFSRNFTSAGMYRYFISCNKTGFVSLNATDILTILNNISSNVSLIWFVPPTPNNKSILNVNYAYINISTNIAGNYSAWIDWNRSVILWYNFESANSTTVYDNSTWGRNGTIGNVRWTPKIGQVPKVVFFDKLHGITDFRKRRFRCNGSSTVPNLKPRLSFKFSVVS